LGRGFSDWTRSYNRRAVRRLVSGAAAAAAFVLLFHSAWIGVPHSWDMLRSQYAVYGSLSPADRQRHFGAAVPLDMGLFDFYRANLHAGDRYWIQIPDDAFSNFADKRTVVSSVARLYLLPAVNVDRLRDANVVLSWDDDPGLLHLRYSAQARAGLQLIFVSRIDRGR
jgi:hypothetical protein